MSKSDLKSVRNWLKNTRKFATGTKYGYHPQLDLPTICIKQYLTDIDGDTVSDLDYIAIHGTEVYVGKFLKELLRGNAKSKKRLAAIGQHENLNVYLKNKTDPSSISVKKIITEMTKETEIKITKLKHKIEEVVNKI